VKVLDLDVIYMMTIDPRLESSSSHVIDLNLCQVRLNNNAAFPWMLLIPQRESVTEIIDLNSSDQHQLIEEISLVSQIMKDLFQPTKLNVASLGNIVPQLHVHIIARFETDQAWPHPVWNSGVNKDYREHEKSERIGLLKNAFLNQKMIQ
jgi:diadenosine tetraphosphate (Ap4A) HIT family hydrolase